MAAGRRPAPKRWSRLERDLRERHGPLIAGVDGLDKDVQAIAAKVFGRDQ